MKIAIGVLACAVMLASGSAMAGQAMTSFALGITIKAAPHYLAARGAREMRPISGRKINAIAYLVQNRPRDPSLVPADFYRPAVGFLLVHYISMMGAFMDEYESDYTCWIGVEFRM